jgi:hypothetical protein
VPEEDDLPEPEMFEDGGKHLERLVVHEGNRPRAQYGIGEAIARPAVNERPAAGHRRQAVGKVSPCPDTAQTFVQEDDRRRLAGSRPDPAVFQLRSKDCDLRQRPSLPDCNPVMHLYQRRRDKSAAPKGKESLVPASSFRPVVLISAPYVRSRLVTRCPEAHAPL